MGSPLSAFGSPPPAVGSARSGSLASRGTESLALSIERSLPVTTRATLEMANSKIQVPGVSVDVEEIYKKTQPHSWKPFPDNELFHYNIKTVSLCNTNMQPFLRKTLGTDTGELGIDPTWFSVSSQSEDHKPTPDPSPLCVALSGEWCNLAHDEYTNFFVRLYRNGTLTFVGAPPPHIHSLEAALDFPMAILRLFVYELINDTATRDQILDSGISTYSNITGGLQFNGIFPDMVSTAVASAHWPDVDLSYEPELTAGNKFYITKLHGAAEYLLREHETDHGRVRRSKISMGKTGHVQILGVTSVMDYINTVAAAEELIHELVNHGHIQVTGNFIQNPKKTVNKLSGEDLRTIRGLRSTISPTAIRATTQLGSDMQYPSTRGNRPDDVAQIENAMRETADILPLAPGEWQGPLQCPGSVTRSTRRVSTSGVARELFTGPVQSDSLCPPGFTLDEQQLLAVGETIAPFDHGTSGEFHIPPDTVSLICLRRNGEFTMSERQVTPRAINNHDIRTLLTPRTREVENEPPITAADDLPITAAATPTVEDVAEEAVEEAAEEAATGQYRTPRADTPRKDGNPFAHFPREVENVTAAATPTVEDVAEEAAVQTPVPEAVQTPVPEAVQTPVPEAVEAVEEAPRKDGKLFAHFEDSDSSDEDTHVDREQTPVTEAVQTPVTEAVQTPVTEAVQTPVPPVTRRKTVFTNELPETFKRAQCSDEIQFRNCGMLYTDMPWNIWYSSTPREKLGPGGRRKPTNDYMFVMWDSEDRSAPGLTTKPFMGVDNMGKPLKPGYVSSTHLKAASAVRRYMDSLKPEAVDSLIGAEAEDPEDTVGNLDDDETITTTDINALEEQVTTGLQGLQERLEVAATRPLQAPTTEVPAQENAPQEETPVPAVQTPVPEVRVGFVRRASFPAFNALMWPPTDRANLKRAMEPHKNVEPELKRVKLVHGTFNRGYTSPGVSINHVRGKMLHIENLATPEAGQEQAPEAELVPTTEVPVRWSPDATISLKALMRRFRQLGHSDRIDAIYGSLNQAGIPPGMGVQAPTLFTKENITRKIAQIERQARQSAGFRSPPAPSS